MSIDLNAERIPLRSVADLRGTVTEDASGLTIGHLWGALAEADTGLLRYLDVQLQRRLRHVLVPVGHARLREREGVATVRLRAALLEDLEAIPPFSPDGEDLDDAYERALLQAHGGAFHGERYYAHPSFDHSALYVGEHPIVRNATMPPGEALLPLSEVSGYGVAKGEPDIRGWPVLGGAGSELGRVADLVVDVACEKVRYAVLESKPGGRRVLLPVGYLMLHPPQEQVTAPALWDEDVASLPSYPGGAVERTDEETVRAILLQQLHGRRRYLAPDFDTRGLQASDQDAA